MTLCCTPTARARPALLEALGGGLARDRRVRRAPPAAGSGSSGSAPLFPKLDERRDRQPRASRPLRAAGRRAGRRGARVGVERMLTVGIDEESNRAAIAAAESSRRLRLRRPPPELGRGLRRRGRRPRSRSSPPTRASARSARPGSTTTATARRARTSARLPAQIEIARRAAKPLVIHVRDAADDDDASPTASRRGAEATASTVILHCFSTPDRVGRPPTGAGTARSPATSPTRRRRRCARRRARVPDELLLVETDAPFLSPQPVRGKPNEPANVVATAEVARRAARDRATHELEATSRRTPRRVFGLVTPAERAGPELPRRHQPARGDRPRRGARRPTTWCSRSAAGRGR